MLFLYFVSRDRIRKNHLTAALYNKTLFVAIKRNNEMPYEKRKGHAYMTGQLVYSTTKNKAFLVAQHSRCEQAFCIHHSQKDKMSSLELDFYVRLKHLTRIVDDSLRGRKRRFCIRQYMRRHPIHNDGLYKRKDT